MAEIFTSTEAKAQLNLIKQALIDNRGVAKDEEVHYNGIKYRAGDLMGELRKDFNWWDNIYQKCLIEEGKSTQIDYKLIKGYDC